MAVIEAPPQETPKIIDKRKATTVAKQFLRDNSTAEGAARQINQSGWNRQFRAQHQDNFDVTQHRYVDSNDYAEKAKDGRWLVVIDNANKR